MCLDKFDAQTSTTQKTIYLNEDVYVLARRRRYTMANRITTRSSTVPPATESANVIGSEFAWSPSRGASVGSTVGVLVGRRLGDAVCPESAGGGDVTALGVGVGGSVGTAVRGPVGEVDGADVGDAVGTAVGTAVGDAVGAGVGSVVGDAVGCALGAGVGLAVGVEVSSTGGEVGVSVALRWSDVVGSCEF